MQSAACLKCGLDLTEFDRLCGQCGSPNRPAPSVIKNPKNEAFSGVPNKSILSGRLDARLDVAKKHKEKFLYLEGEELTICEEDKKGEAKIEVTIKLVCSKVTPTSATSFDIVSPAASVNLVGPNADVVNKWRSAIEEALVSNLKESMTQAEISTPPRAKGSSVAEKRTYGWQHQLQSGTLHSVALKGTESECMQIAGQEGIDINARDDEGCSALHMAAYAGSDLVATVLLSLDADIDARDDSGFTPLHIACKAGRPAVVRVLAEMGCDVNSRDSFGRTGVHLSAQAALRSSPEVIAALSEAGADINAKDGEGNRAMSYCLGGPPNPNKGIIMASLAGHGAEVAFRDSHGRTPLHFAASEGEFIAAHALVHAGSPMNMPDADRNCPLHVCTSLPLAEMLILHGARLDCKNKMDKLPHDYLGGRPEVDDPAQLKDAMTASFAVYKARTETSGTCTEVPESAWVSDKASPTCQLCAAVFSTVKRRHHCRACGRLVCGDCSDKKVNSASSGKAVRVCDCCFNRAARDCKVKDPEITARQSMTLEKEKLKELLDESDDETAQRRKAAKEKARADWGDMDRVHEESRSAAQEAELAMQKLQERGEQFSRIQQKTNDMANEAENFASLARELRQGMEKKSKRFGLF